MKKTIICMIMSAVSLSFLLSGCIQIDVDITIDEHFTATLSYNIQLDVDAVEPQNRDVLKNALHSIGWYYQENLDFTVDLQLDSNPYVLVMTRRVENNSFEQAYESLEKMLTNEDITIFMEVDMAFQSSERQNRYIFNAVADIPQIVQASNAEELTPDLQQQLENAMDTGEGSISLTLPVSEVVDSNYPTQMRYNHAVMTVPLKFNGQTSLQLNGVVNLLEDGTPGGSINEILQEKNKFREISIIVCGAALVIFIILLLILIISGSKRRNQHTSFPGY